MATKKKTSNVKRACNSKKASKPKPAAKAKKAVDEKLTKLKKGELANKYGHLNPGQVRMCAGNRIRAMVKKEAVTVDQAAKVLAAL